MNEAFAEAQNRRIAILTHLAEMSVVLNSTLQLKPLLSFLMDTAADITDAEAASVLLWDHNRNELYFAATTTSTAELNLLGQPVPLENSIAGATMRTQAIVRVDDVHEDPRHYRKLDATRGFQTRSILAVPLTAKDRPIGVLEVLNKHRLPWTEDDENYLSILAAQSAVAIESARLVEKLRQANKELNELDKLKNDFIAVASHELRTPLAVILGYASFLKELSDGEVNEHATKVMNSALQLRRIIEDMTNLRYLKEGEAEIRRARVPLEGLIQEAAGDTRSLGDAKAHELTIGPVPDEATAYVDPIRITMALTNVLNNAMTFTPPGGVIRVETELHSSTEVWITVTDDGIGILPDQMERIFEPFYQVEDHMTRRHGGIGIGLSIARALVEANGGRIWASSPGPGLGATITLALPLAKDCETR
ncbi:MAG: GAF domain-containing protein [Anaerolineae bacterium]|nr:GAF domain-containing protein [Anaerolineae bacterium]